MGVLVLLAAVGTGLFLWLGPGGSVEVKTVTVRESGKKSGAAVLNASGYVTARRRATVSSKITGKLVAVLVEEGMPVREGQVLARLDDSHFQANLQLVESRLEAARRTVDESRARLDLAELTLGRTRRLVEDGILGEAELDADEADVKTMSAQLSREEKQVVVAEREVSLQRTLLADTIIQAPFEGIVISKDAQVGEMVSPVSAGGGFTRTGICTIVDMTSLEIEVDVNESYISRVRPEQPVEATLDAYPDWKIPARVITTIPAADRQKATVEVRIGFVELDPRILPDMGIKVVFLDSAEDSADAGRPRLYLPRAALREQGGRDVVFVVGRGRVERRAVRVGMRSDEEFEILSGLSSGDRVVIGGPDDLQDGDEVTAR